MAKRVLTGCRDCKKCTNSGVANAGRGIGRSFAAFGTAGLSEGARLTTKTCRSCGHKMSLHDVADQAPSGSEPSYSTYGKSRAKRAPDERRERKVNPTLPGNASTPVAPEQAPPTPPGSGLVEMLRNLGELHTSGVLTDEEFAAAKGRLLS